MQQYGKKDVLQTLIHIIGWGIMFSFPFLFSTKTGAVTLTWYLGYIMVPIAFMTIFYVNYFFLIDRLLFRKKIWIFILANLILIGITVYGLHEWHNFHSLHSDMKPPEIHREMPPISLFLMRDYILMALTAGLSVAIKMTGKWYNIENEKRELEKIHAEAELRNLKSQLNPHFLFNTLNNIYALIAVNQDRAQFAIHDLSRLLRHVLYENNDNAVALDKELAFMTSYIELMSLRLPTHVTLRVNIPETSESIFIAPLLFITLIENAFKHGVSSTEESFIDINMEIRGTEEITCHINNSYFPKTDNDRSGSGIGLDNLQKRLQLLYPGHYILSGGRRGNEYAASLTINLLP